jgi:predicted amidophosphoribosyltransferase
MVAAAVAGELELKAVEVNAKFCPGCGADLKAGSFCAQCGAKLQPGAKFCQECGTHTA